MGKIQEKKRTQLPLWSLLLFFSWYWKLEDGEKGSSRNCCSNVLFRHLFILPWAEELVTYYTLVTASELEMKRFLQHLEWTLCTGQHRWAETIMGLTGGAQNLTCLGWWHWADTVDNDPVKRCSKGRYAMQGSWRHWFGFLKVWHMQPFAQNWYTNHPKIWPEEAFQNSFMGFPRWADQIFSCVIAQSG